MPLGDELLGALAAAKGSLTSVSADVGLQVARLRELLPTGLIWTD